MICPECRGKGATIYYRETDRDENSVTVQKFEDICHTCHGRGCKPQTNADRIRAMNDEELADFLYDDGEAMCKDQKVCSEYGCKDCILDWLKQPVREDNDG